MRKTSKVLLIVLGVIVLLIAETAIVKIGSQYEPKVSVLYARTAIKAKTEIKEEMLIESQVPLAQVHKLSVRNKADLTGKKVKVDIEAGEMILTSRLGDVEEMQEIPLENMNNRLFSVEFKPDQVNGWWLLVNQYVDIIFIPNPTVTSSPVSNAGKQTDSSEQNNMADSTDVNNNTVKASDTETGVTIINENTGIVRINNVRVAAIIDDFFKQMNNVSRTGTPKYVCFEVTPEQDEFLAWAKSNGKIELSVRMTIE